MLREVRLTSGPNNVIFPPKDVDGMTGRGRGME